MIGPRCGLEGPPVALLMLKVCGSTVTTSLLPRTHEPPVATRLLEVGR